MPTGRPARGCCCGCWQQAARKGEGRPAPGGDVHCQLEQAALVDRVLGALQWSSRVVNATGSAGAGCGKLMSAPATATQKRCAMFRLDL